MATGKSGSIPVTTSNQFISGKIDWSETYDISTNTSIVTATLYLQRTNTGYTTEGQSEFVISINGNTHKSGIDYRYIYSQTYTNLVSHTVSVPHNSDGTKSVVISAYGYIYNNDMNTQSKTVSLTTIPRKSSLSVSDGTLNTSQTLTVTKQASSFTHTITAKCGNSTSTICTKSSSTSFSFTPPISWASQNTTGTSVSVTYTIETFNGSTSIGSNDYTKTCSIPSSVKPSCSITISEPSGQNHVSIYGGYLNGISKVNIVITPTISYDSQIDSYKTTVDGSTYVSSNFSINSLNTSGTVTITSNVTDKRGRTSNNSTASILVIDYSSPKISNFKVHRCNSDGTENSRGEYIKVTFDCLISPLNNQNTSSYFVSYKKSSDSSFTEIPLTEYTDNYSVEEASYIFEADSGSSYKIILRVEDNFNTSSSSTSASTASVIMNFNANGDGVGIGKICEAPNMLDIGFDTEFRKRVIAPNNVPYEAYDDNRIRHPLVGLSSSNDLYLGSDSDDDAHSGNTNIYSPNGVINLYTYDRVCVKSNDVMTFEHNISGKKVGVGVGRGGTNRGVWDGENSEWMIYSNDTTLYLGPPGKSYFKPYYTSGDSITLNIETAGFITNSSTEVCFTIFFSRPLVNVNTVSISSVGGLIIRQENKYCYGSSSSTYVNPSSYSGALTGDKGMLDVSAIFGNTTNVTNNNDACGIRANITLTFA